MAVACLALRFDANAIVDRTSQIFQWNWCLNHGGRDWATPGDCRRVTGPVLEGPAVLPRQTEVALLESKCCDGVCAGSTTSGDEAGQDTDNEQHHSDSCDRQG